MTAPPPPPLRRPRRRRSPPAALVLLALVLPALLAAPARAAEVIKRGAMQGLFDKLAGGSAAAGVVNAAAAAMGGAARSAIVDEVKRGVLRFPRGEPPAAATAELRAEGFAPPPRGGVVWARLGGLAFAFRLPKLDPLASASTVSAATLAKGRWSVYVLAAQLEGGSLRIRVTEPGGAFAFETTQQPARFAGVVVPGLGVSFADAGSVGIYLGGELERVDGGTSVALSIDAKAISFGGVAAFEAQLAKLERVVPDEARAEL
jgi:hypothetical protein